MNKRNSFFGLLKKFYIYIILLAIYVPLIIIVAISFNQPSARGNIGMNFGVPTFVNYINLFKNDEFINALINSLLLLVVVTPISLLLAITTCLGMWRAKPYQTNAVMFASKITIINPEAITGISLVVLFSSTWIAMGFNFGFFTVALAHISFCTPYAIVAIYPRMAKMNPNLMLASYDLGHSKTNTFFKVTLPYLLPAILSAAAICAAMSLDDFVITNLVNGDFQTIGTLIYTSRKGIKAWIIAFGAFVIVITITVILITGIAKYVKFRRNTIKRSINA